MIFSNINGSWIEVNSVLAVQPVPTTGTVRIHLKSGQFVSIKPATTDKLEAIAHSIVKQLLNAADGKGWT